MVDRGSPSDSRLPPGLAEGSSTGEDGDAAGELSRYDVEEILSYIGEALNKFGAAGVPGYSDGLVQLQNPGELTEIPLGPWARRWQELDEGTRRLRTTEVARRLCQPRLQSSLAPPRFERPGRYLPLLAALAVFAVAVAGYLHLSDGTLGAVTREATASAPPRIRGESPPPVATDEDRAEQSARTCATTRARVVRGATVSIADADGWVVEYAGYARGARRPLASHGALDEFVAEPANPAGSRFIWAAEPDMVDLETSDTLVQVRHQRLNGSSGEPIYGVRLTFTGTLVDAYFDERSRHKFFHLAAVLTRALGITHAALFARCATQATHHLGSWFFGENEPAAAASLIFWVGVHSDPPHLAPSYLEDPATGDPDPSGAFAASSHATRSLDRPFMATLLGRQGGRIASLAPPESSDGRASPDGPGPGVVITFPFRDGNRASRASRELTRLLEVSRPTP